MTKAKRRGSESRGHVAAAVPAAGVIGAPASMASDMKIIATRWSDGSFEYFVKQLGNGDWMVHYSLNGQPPRSASEFTPKPFFDTAQIDLDRAGQRKGWTPNPLLEDDEEPKPTRRRSRESRAESRDPDVLGTIVPPGTEPQAPPAGSPPSSLSAMFRSRIAGDPSAFAEGMFGRSSLSPSEHVELDQVAKHRTAAKKAESQPSTLDSPPSTSLIDVDLKLVDPSPWQPRQDFPEAEMAVLGASLRVHQDMAIIVRAKGDRYELVEGERRVRAARHAGLHTLRAEVQDLDDAQVREMVLRTDRDKKPLNAIEKARGFQAIMEAEQIGPTELARRPGYPSQGEISSLVHLLELPDEWQKRVISQEIPAAHAKAVLPFRQRPALLKVISAYLKQQNRYNHDSIGTVADFRQSVANAVRSQTRSLDRTEYDSTFGGQLPAMKLSDEERRALDVITIEGWDGHPNEVATQVKLFDEMWAKHKKQVIQRRLERQQKNSAKSKQPLKVTESMSPEKRKEIEAHNAAEAKRKAAEAADRHRRRLAEWFYDALRYLISEKLMGAVNELTIVRVLVIAASRLERTQITRCKPAADAIGAKSGQHHHEYEAAGLLCAADDVSAFDCAAKYAASLFWLNGPAAIVNTEIVGHVAAGLEISVETAWLDGQLSTLAESYFALQTKEELERLAKELEIELPAGASKIGMVEAFVAAMPGQDSMEAGPDLPKELKALAKSIEKKAKKARK